MKTLIKNILTVCFLIGTWQLLYAQQSKISEENFTIVDDFEKNKSSFKTDKFDLPNISVDGGKAIAYHSEKKNYTVYELMLSGETEKFRYVFYADKNSKVKIIKQVEYKYDKPETLDNERKETTTYYSYEKKSLFAYNSKRELIKDSDSNKKEKLDKLFEEVIDRK